MLDFRKGTLVNPNNRLDEKKLMLLHETSLEILEKIGINCLNEKAVTILDKAGCKVEKKSNDDGSWNIKFPEKVVMNAVNQAPGKIVLGARDPQNKLLLDSEVPYVYFGTGSETNIYLDSEKKNDEIIFNKKRGSLNYLCESAKLCNELENADFFIRNVNLQDSEINFENKDVNVFFASLLYMTKHVQAGLVNIDKLEDIIIMAEIIAGGKEELKNNPIISFITCIIKSPLQMVDDTTSKLIKIAENGLPVVLSSSPQGGSTAPIQEEGMVSMINAEILAGITLAQSVNPGTPVLYGAVPVRARLDTLHDLYGAPEFIHYNMDCIQLARFYKIPCYSTAGVGDAKVPGMQATVEKVFSQLQAASAGAQYIHYAFGLLDKTNCFCPLQALLDDANISIVREILRKPSFEKEDSENVIKQLTDVMNSDSKIFARYIRKSMRKGLVSLPYKYESSSDKDEVLIKAQERLEEIRKQKGTLLEESKIDKIFNSVDGLLPKEKFNI